MENIDPKTAQRVWQRVTASAAPQSLKPLVYTLGETAVMYQKLAQQVNGSASERLKQMAARTRQNATALRGMGHLRGEKIQPVQMKVTKELDRLLPEKSCRRAQMLAQEFEMRKNDPEWGKLFEILAGQQWEDALFLLAILGERT